MKNKKKPLFLLFALAAAAAQAEIDFDLGADIRIRHEMMRNIPGLPGGGRAMPLERLDEKSHMRFRTRFFGEVSGDAGESGKWRIFTRLTDEMRWYIQPTKGNNTFPDELILDNLFIEGTGIFDGFLDISIGRQDIFNLYGLDHVFVDGTPGDGSRSIYSDIARMAFNFTEDSKLDLFFLYNQDDNHLRWGTDRGAHRPMSGLGGGAEPDMDDWGYGAIWSSHLGEHVPYQVFAMQKQAASYRLDGVKHPSFHRELFGAKFMPAITESISLQLEAMGQVGRNSEGDWLSGWSTYSGINWKGDVAGVRSSASVALHIMSGDEDAATEDGGHHAWDPMWARGVNDSELMLNGTHYGTGWWSNMILLKTTYAMEFGRRHTLKLEAGPMFAQCEDGLGGGNGNFKGLLSWVRYDFPLLVAGEGEERSFEVFGHVVAEYFNPGDYFETDRPSWFLRWQIELVF